MMSSSLLFRKFNMKFQQSINNDSTKKCRYRWISIRFSYLSSMECTVVWSFIGGTILSCDIGASTPTAIVVPTLTVGLYRQNATLPSVQQ
jgi:hypothetical protein